MSQPCAYDSSMKPVFQTACEIQVLDPWLKLRDVIFIMSMLNKYLSSPAVDCTIILQQFM